MKPTGRYAAIVWLRGEIYPCLENNEYGNCVESSDGVGAMVEADSLEECRERLKRLREQCKSITRPT